MGLQGLQGLKGLTAQDRADWEKQFAAQLEGRSQEEMDRAWLNYNFKHKYGDREDYSTLSQMSAEEKEAYYNNDYDRNAQDMRSTLMSDSIKAETVSALRDRSVVEAVSDNTRVYNPDLEAISRGVTPERQEEFRQTSNAYHEALMRYDKEYNMSYVAGRQAGTDLRDLAEQISPYYRAYKGTDLLPFSEDDWVEMAKEYNARAEAYGVESANMYMQKTIQDTASKNQSTAEKWWNGFLNLGASAYAMIVDATAGVVKGNWDYFSGNHQDVEGAGWFVNYLDAIMDNSVTRYADKVLKTGTIFTDSQDYYEKLGVSRIPVIQTYDQETGSTDLSGMIFNENFLPNALGQYGFTIGSMFMGAGEAKLAGWAFKGVKGATVAANTARTGQTAMQVRNALSWIQKAENATNRWLIPGVVGTYEGLQEGLNTKLQFLEEGQRQIADVQSQFVDNKFRELVDSEYQKRYDEAMKSNPLVLTQGDTQGAQRQINPEVLSRQILEQLYQEAWNAYDEQYGDAEKQLNYDAAKAGTNTFLLNSAINGVINQTLKATLFSPSITGAIRQTRLGRLVTPKGTIKVTGTGSDITATAVMPWYKQAWNIVKEPLGEGLEEYTQDIADAASRGGARNNLTHFLDNKYNGDGSAVVGEIWSDDIAAATLAAGEAAVSKESFRDAIYGATSSIMGGPHRVHRAIAVDNKGNVLRNTDGSVQRTLFGRGLNSAGEVESNMERIARLMPWRSGAVQAWRENKAQKKELEEAAQAVTDWLRNPDNMAKYDGTVGTFAWAREMQRAAENNDEFGYRTSATGKAINDALMLDKLQGTEFYDSFMQSVIDAANLESGSREAQDAIDMMRANISTSEAVRGLSDDEILQQIRDNANKMLDMQSGISEASSRLDKMFGNLDDDTKESLIYGELQIKDWQDRHKKLSKEIASIVAEAGIDDTVEKSNLSQVQANLMTQHGSIQKALADRDALRVQITELEKLISTAKKRGNLNDYQKEIVRKQEEGVKKTKELLKGYQPLEGVEGNLVLSESEIIALDPVSRAIMLKPENKGNYSQAQQVVINNLVSKATAQDAEFLSKIEDDGKIQQATQKYIDDYTSVIADPSTFDIYSRRAKSDAANDAYKKRYDALRDIEDYSEFSHAMDKLYTNASFAERNTILRQFDRDERVAEGLGTSTNYGRYKAERQQIAEILKNASRSEEFSNLSHNDINMFVHAVTYLTEQGVNLNDQEAVTNTLSQVDENGSKFEQYVTALNADADIDSNTDFTSVGEVVQMIKDVVGKYNKDTQESAATNAPVVATPTTGESNNPVTPPAPGIFGTNFAHSTLEEASKAQQREVQDAPKDGNGEAELSTTLNPRTEAYTRNSNAEVAQQAEVIGNIISNTGKSEESRNVADNTLSALQDNIFNSIDEFLTAIEAEANRLDTAEDNPTNQEAAELLRNAVVRVRSNAENARIQAERRAQLNQIEAVERSSLLGRAMGVSPTMIANTRSNNITTTDIQWLKRTSSINPEDSNYSPLLAYLDRYHVEQFLQSDKIGRDTPVYFISDPQLRAEQEELYNSKGLPYNTRNMPLIPVVESENGPITIGDRHYQPIGVMPATDAKNRSGSSRLNLIRDRINSSDTGPKLLVGEDGTPIQTRLSGNVKAEPIGQRETNGTVQEVGLEGLNDSERQELSKLTSADMRKHPLYQKMKDSFLKRLRFDPNKVSKKSGKTYGGLTIDIPTLKNGSSFPADIWIREVHRSTDSNGTSISDLLNSNNPSALTANSRISGYMRTLDRILSAFDDEVVSFVDGNPTEGTINAVNSLAEQLNSKLSNFIRTRGFSYIVTPTGKETPDGKAVLTLSMTDSAGNVVSLGEVHSGNLSESEKMGILRNLIMEGDHVRMQDSFHAVAQWNVDYHNVDVAREDIDAASEDRQKMIQAARADLSHVYDDDILETSKPSLSYQVNTVSLEAPYTLEGERRHFETVANPDNATGATPMNDTPLADSQVTTSNGSVVDGDTGVTLQGSENIVKSEAEKIAENLAKLIQKDASRFSLADDESHYIDSQGKKYARVTSVISADVEGKKFDPESPWITPSTNIGTGVDELTRDFFADRIVMNEETKQFEVDGHLIGEVYPNSTQKALTNFIAQLEAFKRKLTADGITILTREVMAHGTLQVTDNESNIHTIDVAGTLDLLGYDREGNWHIYDMKTIRNANVDDSKKAKWSRQLSLYKKFLEDSYGIKVKDLTVIPIKVDYPAPSQRTRYSVSADKHDAYNGRTGNQLIINDTQKFEGARPTLMPTIPIEGKSLNIQYDKLSDAEKEVMNEIKDSSSQLLQDQSQVVDQDSQEVNATPETVVNTVDVDSTNATPVIDPTSSMPEIEDISGLFSKKRKRKGKAKSTDATNPLNQYVSSNQAWGVFDGQGLDIQETVKNLEQAGITEEKWNQMSDDERQHELDCKGVKL